jgi:tRNA(Met) C34 N-acetyltransferase TmcA
MSPEKRKTTYSFKLIKKAEEYAKLNQIDYVMMACMENPRPERLTQFYKRIGYLPVQTQFYKKIN